MKHMCFVISLFSVFYAVAQDSIQYDSDFEFYDGLYMSFEDFKNDNPISFDKVISTLSVNDPLLIDGLLREKSFRYKDGLGEIREMLVNEIWGFAWHGRPFVRLNAINYMGIVSNLGKLRQGRNEYGNFTEIGSISIVQVNMLMSNPIYSAQQTGQFLFSMKTGNLMPYGTFNAKEMFADDQELLIAFKSLGSVEKQEQQLFLFIRRYNERHPLYFPFYE